MTDDLDLRHPSFEELGVKWSPVGLEITRDLAYDDLESVAYVLSRTVDAGRWGLADALSFAERRWGEDRYSQLAAVTGRSPGGLMNLASLARRVPREVRRRELSVGHHEEVSALKVAGTDEPDHAAQARWLEQAVDLRLSRDELRAQIQAVRPDLTRRVRSKPSPPLVVSPPSLVPTPPSDIVYGRIIDAARAVIDSASEPKRDRSGRKRCWVDDDLLNELDRALGETE